MGCFKCDLTGVDESRKDGLVSFLGRLDQDPQRSFRAKNRQ